MILKSEMLSEWKYEVVVERQPEINATANDRISRYFKYIPVHFIHSKPTEL